MATLKIPKIKNKKLKKVGKFFKKLPRIMGENAFLTSLVFFSIAVILGLLVFYKYSILVEKKEPQSTQALLYFDEKNLQEIIKAWQDRQAKFDAADSKRYVNPFKLAP
jgi:hypothetical protein